MGFLGRRRHFRFSFALDVYVSTDDSCVRTCKEDYTRKTGGSFRVVYYTLGTSTSCYEDGTARRERRVDHYAMMQTGHQ
jgi:hypothetical protein